MLDADLIMKQEIKQNINRHSWCDNFSFVTNEYVTNESFSYPMFL